METAAAEEFTKKASARNLSFADRQEVVEQSSQTPSFGIFRYVVRYIFQDWFGIILHYSQFEKEGRVECGVGVFLKWEYPFFLATAHALPTGYGLLGTNSSIFVVADDATKQPIVGGWNPVVIIDRKSGKS